jgi:hypothetical protein
MGTYTDRFNRGELSRRRGCDLDPLGRDFFSELVSLPDGLEQVAAAQVGKILAQHVHQDGVLPFLDRALKGAEDRAPAGQRLEAAAVATTALRVMK